jgi:hypothetical protein
VVIVVWYGDSGVGSVSWGSGGNIIVSLIRVALFACISHVEFLTPAKTNYCSFPTFEVGLPTHGMF